PAASRASISPKPCRRPACRSIATAGFISSCSPSCWSRSALPPICSTAAPAAPGWRSAIIPSPQPPWASTPHATKPWRSAPRPCSPPSPARSPPSWSASSHRRVSACFCRCRFWSARRSAASPPSAAPSSAASSSNSCRTSPTTFPMPRHGRCTVSRCCCSCTRCRAAWSARSVRSPPGCGRGGSEARQRSQSRRRTRQSSHEQTREVGMTVKHTTLAGLSAIGLIFAAGLAFAAGQYGPGASDTEIKIGNTMPYSGPASSYGVLGKVDAAYFAMINQQGGINGRKVTFISRDDSYSPPKTVELVRQIVEQDKVLFMYHTLGTPPNMAIHGYLNENKVPQLFLATGADQWNDPKHFPWTMMWLPSYGIESHIYANYILKNLPNAKIAVLYQNDDYGKDYLNGLRAGLGDKASKMIVATQSYETTDPTVDQQVVALQGSGADVLLTAAIPKFAAQTVRKVYDIGWKPTHFLNSVGNSVGLVMKPAGLEKGVGIISATFAKDPTDPQWQNTPEYKEWLDFMKSHGLSANITDAQAAIGYSYVQTMVAVLKACGDNLTRENVMKQAASLHNLSLPMLLPGITLNTSADDFSPIKQMQLQKFDGTTWKLFGDVVSASGS